MQAFLFHLLLTAFLVLSLTACGGGSSDESGSGTSSSSSSSSSSGSVSVSTYTVKGMVSGLTSGTLVLQNNGADDLTITDDGFFAFQAALEDGATYSVAVATEPERLLCSLTNNVGTISGADVTDVTVTCEDAGSALNVVGYGDIDIDAPKPIIQWPFKIIDRFTGEVIDEVTIDQLEVLENGEPLSVRESFLDLEKIEATQDFSFHTVLMLDVSSSLTNDDVEHVKNAVKNMIRDPDTEKSKLGDNHTVSVYVFDSSIEEIISESSDIASLTAAVDSVTVGSASTNLYGAVVEGAAKWINVFTLDQFSTGAMILITDGRDTASVETEAAAIDASEGKEIYAIAVGSDVDEESLSAIAGAHNVFSSGSFDDISAILADAKAAADSIDDGLYLLYYATPKRSGSHTVRVTAPDAYSCSEPVGDEQLPPGETFVPDCSDGYDLVYSADGLADVEPEFVLRGRGYAESGDLLVEAKTLWTHDATNYNWSVTSFDAGLVHTIETADNAETAVFSLAPNAAGGQATVSVTDLNRNRTLIKSVRIGEGLFVSAFDGYAEIDGPLTLSYNRSPVTLVAETRGGSEPPVYSWSIDSAAVATLSAASGDTVDVARVSDNTENTATVIRIQDTANGFVSAYEIANQAPLLNPSRIESGGGVSCALDDNGVTCWGDESEFRSMPTFVNPTDLAVGGSFSCVLHDKGVQCFGRYTGRGYLRFPPLTNPSKVVAGVSHACAIDDFGVKCWGGNFFEQADAPDITNPQELALGYHHSCALNDSGLHCWGLNRHGQANEPLLTNPTEITAGYEHTCALDDDGVQCWGLNDYGQTDVPPLVNPRQISASGNRTCALDDDGATCWGQDRYGDLSVPALNDPTQISAGTGHICALDADGVQCWGPGAVSTLPQ